MKTTVFFLICLVLLASFTQAGSGAGAINLTFNTSARFEAMGSAGVGAPWGTDTNHWANPALLAFRPGVNFMYFHSELAVGLADDIFLTNKELTIGAYGVTLLVAKGPGMGNYLDMGEQLATDESGVELGVFESYMKAKTWGLGVDIVRVLDKVNEASGQNWSRYASVAVGYTRTDFEDMLAPDNSLQDSRGSGTATASGTSKGIVVRVTPLSINALGSESQPAPVGLIAGLSYGRSLLNDTDEFIVHVESNQSDPYPRTFLRGWSAHLEVPLAPAVKNDPTSGFGGLLADTISPIFSFTYASHLSEPGYVWTGTDYVYEHDTSSAQEEKGHGWELGLANILFLRRGHTTALYGDIDADTSGWGINLQVGRLFGLRYDEATVPQASGLPDVTRRGATLWVDPIAIANH